MSIIQTVKSLFGGDEQRENAQLYSCRSCSNLFTTNEASDGPSSVTCPNCGSDDVDLAVR
ncbi:MAG: hypothetical protein ABEJ74_08470 [Haloferacaceae archaeon]